MQNLKDILKFVYIIYSNFFPQGLTSLENDYIQLDKIQCDFNKCYYSNEEGVYFADGSHISKIGAKLFTKSFEIIFE